MIFGGSHKCQSNVAHTRSQYIKRLVVDTFDLVISFTDTADLEPLHIACSAIRDHVYQMAWQYHCPFKKLYQIFNDMQLTNSIYLMFYRHRPGIDMWRLSCYDLSLLIIDSIFVIIVVCDHSYSIDRDHIFDLLIIASN